MFICVFSIGIKDMGLARAKSKMCLMVLFGTQCFLLGSLGDVPLPFKSFIVLLLFQGLKFLLFIFHLLTQTEVLTKFYLHLTKFQSGWKECKIYWFLEMDRVTNLEKFCCPSICPNVLNYITSVCSTFILKAVK